MKIETTGHKKNSTKSVELFSKVSEMRYQKMFLIFKLLPTLKM
jgi:hypothetical protein